MHGLEPTQFWQALPALPHAPTAVPIWQVVPLTQPVQQAPSRHLPPVQLVPVLRTCWQPVAGSHESSVQTSLSLQFLGVPVHERFEQTSPVVHALPSLHVAVFGG